MSSWSPTAEATARSRHHPARSAARARWYRASPRNAQSNTARGRCATLELNVYYVATDPDETSDAVEQRVVDVLTAVKQAVAIPVAVKLSPYYSSFPRLARRLDEAGADGLVVFDRFSCTAFGIALRRLSSIGVPRTERRRRNIQHLPKEA